MNEKLSRKEFFKESAKYFAGVSAGLVGAGALANKEARGAPAYTWPWPYTTLDKEKVRILAHDSFWSGYACCYGAFNGIIQALRDAIGAPYTDLPTELMIYGHGGGAGWGTVCGAINGSAAAISLVCEKSVSDQLVSELFGWYTQTNFPSDESNQYGVNHNFTDTRCDVNLPQNKSGSPLCHVSVSEWCSTANLKVSDLQRKERCARLAGDVASYAVQILNDHFSGSFNPVYVPPESIAACMTCHGASFQDNVITKMNCEPCHGDPHAASGISYMDPEVPRQFNLDQNYPNPFNPSTTIEFSIPKTEQVKLSVYDLNGRHIKTLIDGRLYPAGKYSIQWDGRDNFGEKVSSGMYYYHIEAGGFAKAKSMLMIK